MQPKIHMFLAERDRARLRGDTGVDRSLTADLKRLGVGPEETLASMAVSEQKRDKKRRRNAQLADARQRRRTKQPRCEHNSLPEHCPECTPELLAQ